MKLLLTSAGIKNNSIAKSLDNLTKIDRKDIKIGFVPTSANGEPGSKDWYISQITDLYKHEFRWIDFIDFSASNVNWEERLDACNVIYMSGGNTFHLLKEVRNHHFDKWLDNNLKKKVYVGTSAGSILLTPTISICTVEPADINNVGLKDFTGLNYVDFEISPHTPEQLTYESNEKYADKSKRKLYAIDDNTAIQVVDKKVKVISEGNWKQYN